jgi:putative hydrolase of the HAD superfamily
MLISTFPKAVHTVTFDCWSTLIYEKSGQHGGRARQLAKLVGTDENRAEKAFAAGWKRHQQAWHHKTVFAGPDILRHTLQTLGVDLPPYAFAEVLEQLEQDILAREIKAIDGAREFLAALRAAGIRTALICDTGFTPGRIVRILLARVGLLEHLEVAIFSEEIGVPKPDQRAFQSALSALSTRAEGAVHVGDLRRSDVAGARAAGMISVRFRGHHDDGEAGSSRAAGIIDCVAAGCNPPCARPEADFVADSYAHLSHIFRPRLSGMR